MINNIWILIGKKLSNEATASELEELERLLSEDKTGNYPMDLIESLWQTTENTEIHDKDSAEKWNRLALLLNDQPSILNKEVDAVKSTDAQQLSERKRTVQKSFPVRSILIALAACVILVFLSVTIFKNVILNKQQTDNIKIATANGAIRKVFLPDGSSVILNAGSDITYQKTFNAEHRELTLSGEALFDIAKDPKHPFIVHTEAMNIQVLGTKFNVKAYPDDNTAEATLFRGSIELTVINDPERHIRLKPSDKVKIVKEVKEKKAVKDVSKKTESPPVIKMIELSQIKQSKADTIPEEMMWVNNKIVFDSEMFVEIAKEMERRYNVKISFANPKAETFRFTGSFEDISISQALNQLKLIADFNYRIEDKTVTIY